MIKIIILFCYSLLLVGPLYAQDTIMVKDDFRNIDVGAHSYRASYPEKDQWHSDTLPWKKMEEQYIRLSPNVYHCFKVIVKNESDADKSCQLFLQNVQIDYAKLTVYQGKKEMFTSPMTGCTLSGKKRPTYDRTLSLPVFLKASSVSEIYIEVYRKEFGVTVDLVLVDPINGIDFRWTDYIFQSVLEFNFLFILSGIVLIYFAKRKRIYLQELNWFLIYVSTGILYILAASGYGSLYLWGDYPWFEINAAIFFGAVSNFAFIHFCKYALGIHKNNTFLLWWFNIISTIYLLISFLGFGLYQNLLPTGMYSMLLGLTYLGILTCITIIIFMGIKKAFFEKQKVFYWFLSIFIFHIAFTIVVLALELGTIRYNIQLHAQLLGMCYFPQMALTLAFLTSKFIIALEHKAHQMQMLREDIAQDIHNEIGAQLTKISLSSHLFSSSAHVSDDKTRAGVAKMGDDAISANKRLRELLFSIYPTNGNFDMLLPDLKELGVEIYENTDTNIEFNVIKSKYNPQLDRIIRTQIYTCCKEIFHLFKTREGGANIVVSSEIFDENTYDLEIRYVEIDNNPKDLTSFVDNLSKVIKTQSILHAQIESGLYHKNIIYVRIKGKINGSDNY